MLYVFHGTDTRKVVDQAHNVVETLRKRQPQAEVFLFEGPIADGAHLDALLEARGLFVEKHVVVLKQPFESPESKTLVLERIERFALSPNIFVLIEGKLEAAHKKHITQHATLTEEHTRTQEKKQHNAFALSDALGARNRRQAWVEYVCARRKGMLPEMLHGTLAWAMRTMLLVHTKNSAEEANLKPFIYTKYKRYLQNYGPAEVRTRARDLVRIYHEARRGTHDLDTALERWILSL